MTLPRCESRTVRKQASLNKLAGCKNLGLSNPQIRTQPFISSQLPSVCRHSLTLLVYCLVVTASFAYQLLVVTSAVLYLSTHMCKIQLNSVRIFTKCGIKSRRATDQHKGHPLMSSDSRFSNASKSEQLLSHALLPAIRLWSNRTIVYLLLSADTELCTAPCIIPSLFPEPQKFWKIKNKPESLYAVYLTRWRYLGGWVMLYWSVLCG